jgi:hypothetical protein
MAPSYLRCFGPFGWARDHGFPAGFQLLYPLLKLLEVRYRFGKDRCFVNLEQTKVQNERITIYMQSERTSFQKLMQSEWKDHNSHAK